MTEIQVTIAPPEEVEADVLAVGLTDPFPPLTGAAAALDRGLGGRLTKLADEGEIRAKPGHVAIIHVEGIAGANRLAVAGLGEQDKVTADSVRTAAAAAARRTKDFAKTLAWSLDESLPLSRAEQVRAAVEGVFLGSYETGQWKSSDDDRGALERLVLVGEGDELGEEAERARIIARWTNRARDLSNMPPNELTPERLAEIASEVADEAPNLAVEALGPDETKQLNMGAFNAVAQGAHNPSRLIVMRYDPPAAGDSKVLGVVGKAITFDTGGISIKPSDGMEEMKHDMSGGAAVVAAMGAIAELGTPVKTLAVVAATENMPGGGAYRPGDILTARNGKTIEIITTDAEGRLVLADALTYAREQGATHIIDLATLTGAMVVALGDLYAGVFSNDDGWRDEIVAAGADSGDRVWPMPMDPRYRRMIDSDYADMRNAGKYRMAGGQAGAELLQEFAGEGPWAHLDIAGPAALSFPRGDYLSQTGGTGYGVRLIAELASRLAD